MRRNGTAEIAVKVIADLLWSHIVILHEGEQIYRQSIFHLVLELGIYDCNSVFLIVTQCCFQALINVFVSE